MTSPDTVNAVVGPAGVSRRYRGYVLGVLFFVYAFNWADRTIIMVLMEPMKVDLGLSDTQLGFLSGIAFALFYALAGIPIARWADRGRRVKAIALALIVWSSMTVAFGLAKNFVTLVITRIGIAIGVAGLNPPALSLISSYYEPERRARAISIYSSGIAVGSLVGTLAAAWIADSMGWRMAYIVVGLPGILFGLVVWLTIREPANGRTSGQAGIEQAPRANFREACTYLWARRSFRQMLLATGVTSFVSYGSETWISVLLIRIHGMGIGETGTWLAMIWGIAGIAGTLAGGYLADLGARRDRRWYMWLPAWTQLIASPLFLLVFLLPNGLAATAVYAIPYFLVNIWLAPVFAMTQSLTPVSMRATAAAILFAWMVLIGQGFGAQAVGLLSDLLANTLGVESVRWALVICGLFNFLGAVHYFLAAKSIRQDLDAAQEQNVTEAAGRA